MTSTPDVVTSGARIRIAFATQTHQTAPIVSPTAPAAPAPAPQSLGDCEYCRKAIQPDSTKRHNSRNQLTRRFCNAKCRAMKWKLDHPEKWGKMGIPIQVGGDKRKEKKQKAA